MLFHKVFQVFISLLRYHALICIFTLIILIIIFLSNGISLCWHISVNYFNLTIICLMKGMAFSVETKVLIKPMRKLLRSPIHQTRPIKLIQVFILNDQLLTIFLYILHLLLCKMPLNRILWYNLFHINIWIRRLLIVLNNSPTAHPKSCKYFALKLNYSFLFAVLSVISLKVLSNAFSVRWAKELL